MVLLVMMAEQKNCLVRWLGDGRCDDGGDGRGEVVTVGKANDDGRAASVLTLYLSSLLFTRVSFLSFPYPSTRYLLTFFSSLTILSYFYRLPLLFFS